MGPPFLNGGNSSTSKRTGWTRSSFNGAAVSQRRKRLPRVGADYPVFASMGPPFLNGGNVFNGLSPQGVGGLQWGRRFSTAETAAACAANRGTWTLQWGRRFSTAETSPPSAAFPFSPPPSMGPPFLNGGNARPFVQ